MVKTLSGTKKDNSNIISKVNLRLWLINQMPEADSVLDIYGSYGVMYNKVWNRLDYKGSKGDALRWLETNGPFRQYIFDVDPHGSPYEALAIIQSKATQQKIGVVCTDGAIQRAGKQRSPLPNIVAKTCGFNQNSKALKAAIFYHYPQYLRFILRKIMPDWDLQKLAIKYALGNGQKGTSYWAGLFCKT